MEVRLITQSFSFYKFSREHLHDLLDEVHTYQFLSITPTEVSYITSDEQPKTGYLEKTDQRRCFELCGTFEFSEENVGITAKLSTLLANAGISLCFIGTFDTDYIFVQQAVVDKAIAAFQTHNIPVIQ